MANPLISQGTLNRLRGSIIIPDHPELNVTASFLGPDGISLALDGKSVVYLPTLTGAARSPEPYLMVTLTVNLLKTQSLSDLYKLRMELDASLGDITARTDAATLSDYALLNCSIVGVGQLSFAGKDVGYGAQVEGYYAVNSSLYNLG